MSEQFDRAYYQRFYVNPRTAVTNRAEMNARGRLIAAMADHLGLPVKSEGGQQYVVVAPSDAQTALQAAWMGMANISRRTS